MIGWGTTYTFDVSQHLQKTNVAIRTDEACFNGRNAPWYGYGWRAKHSICVGGFLDGIYDATAGGGDSGGPIVCRDPDGYAVLCGVTAFGSGEPF